MQNADTTESEHEVEPASILQLFERQAARVPDQVALRWEQGQLTYRQVAQRVRALAGLLVSRGVEPGRAVAVAMPRGPGAVIGILAVWAAGGVYVPVDPGLPSARARLMRAETEPCCVLAEHAGAKSEWLRDVFELLPVVALDDFGIARSDEVEFTELHGRFGSVPEQLANRPAYVLYTSGSTGRPKGVIIEHRAILNYVTWLKTYLSLDESDRVLLQTALSFDVSVGQCFTPLISGSCVVVARPGVSGIRSMSKTFFGIRTSRSSILFRQRCEYFWRRSLISGCRTCEHWSPAANGCRRISSGRASMITGSPFTICTGRPKHRSMPRTTDAGARAGTRRSASRSAMRSSAYWLLT